MGAAERLRAALADNAAAVESLERQHAEIVAASESSNADDEHDPEGATIAFEREQVRALLRQARSSSVALSAALARVTDGTYGVCSRCGGPIGEARLDARPDAVTCIRCASR